MGGNKRIIDPNAPSVQEEAVELTTQMLKGRIEHDELRTQLLADLVESIEELTVTVRSCVDAFIDKTTSVKLSRAIEKRMEKRMELREAAEKMEGENGDTPDRE